MSRHVLVTGMGICSPVGTELGDVFRALKAGESGIRPIESFDASRLTMRHAGEVKCIPDPDRFPPDRYRVWDRGTRMAMHAAGEALSDAGLNNELLASGRVGICIGTSGSGQYQNARFRLDKTLPLDDKLVYYLSRNSPHFQSSQLAANYGVHGPNLAIGAATAGSGIALATALAWLRNDRVDAVLVGGSEAFSLLNVLGFDQLGLTIPQPCTPFSGTPGMTFGEGAGFLVLEQPESAERRRAQPHAVLQSVAIRADGFDPIHFDPSGSGQSRAMQAALADAGLEAEQIDWIRASGTGGRDQDLAETLAIKTVFKQPPPVSSIEPFMGHANGAGPAIQLVAAILCMQHNWLPPTLGCNAPRPGCDLDYVADGPRLKSLHHVLCNTAAFGGKNCAVIVSRYELPAQSPVRSSSDDVENQRPAAETIAAVSSAGAPVGYPLEVDSSSHDDVVITGLGIISAAGCGGHEQAAAFVQRDHWLVQQDRLGKFSRLRLGGVLGFNPKRHCPSVKLRGVELLTQYAAAAVNLALEDADLRKPAFQPNRIGVTTAISRPSGDVFQRLFMELQLNGFRPLIGRLMLRNGRFMIASQLSNWYDLRGYSSTISLGIGSGLHALISAVDQLRGDPSMDALVVVACDELSEFTLNVLEQSRVLNTDQGNWQPYAKNSQGFVPGEGAVAVIVERRGFAEQRGGRALARVTGAGLSFDGLPGRMEIDVDSRPAWEACEPSGDALVRCYRDALAYARITPAQVDRVLGNGCGVWDWDQAELLAMRHMFGDTQRVDCINGTLGFCEATSALFNLAAAVEGLQRQARDTRAFVAARTEQGHNAAIVLEMCG
jgi:3-oxoacyl-[acyl-carrier-protein] synthase II